MCKGNIIGVGYHGSYGGPHAEVKAVEDAIFQGNSDKLKESVVYVTLEPCSHFGKTPPCVDLLIKHNVKRLLFSSSATVYGDPHQVPITEKFPVSPTNPYGRTKLMIDEILRLTGSNSKVEKVLPYREGEAMDQRCDNSKMLSVIGDDFIWTPLDRGLRRAIRSYEEEHYG